MTRLAFSRVAELPQDLGRVTPGSGGCRGITHGGEDVAEVEEGVGLVVAVAELPEQAEGMTEPAARLDVVAEPAVDEPEAVRRVGLPLAMPVGSVELECLVTMLERHREVAQQGVAVAQGVEGDSLTDAMSGGPEELECLGGMVVGFLDPPLPFPQQGQVHVGGSLGRGVTEPLEEGEGAPQVRVRLVEFAHLDAGVGQMP